MDAMLVHSSPIFVDQAAAIAELSREFRLPSIGLFPIYAKVGGLISYGPNNFDLIKQAGGNHWKDTFAVRRRPIIQSETDITVVSYQHDELRRTPAAHYSRIPVGACGRGCRIGSLPHLAPFGLGRFDARCRLLGEDRKSPMRVLTSEIDPTETLAAPIDRPRNRFRPLSKSSLEPLRCLFPRAGGADQRPDALARSP